MFLLISLWGLAGNIRSDFLPPALQESYQLRTLVPHVDWYWLVIAFLTITLIFYLFGSYKTHMGAMAAKDNEIDMLQARIDEKEKHDQIGRELARLHNNGMSLKTTIVGSDDSLSVSEAENQIINWGNDVFQLVEREISAGKANHIIQVDSVDKATISGMKSNTTREDKNTMLLYHSERLKRLSDLMKEF